MNKASKKTSTKIIVDQYDKYCRVHQGQKRPKGSQHQKEELFPRFIDEQLSDRPFGIQEENHSNPLKQLNAERKAENKVLNENFYDLMSESDEQPINLLMKRHNKDHRQIKNKSRTHVFPIKKEEINPKNRMYKNHDYFPQEAEQKIHIEQANKPKRPLSSMVKKNNTHNTLQKQKQPALKKNLSTSKLKEQHRTGNVSLHKQRVNNESSYHRKNDVVKNHISLRRQLNSQYQEPVIQRLKKKNVTLAQKPLRIQDERNSNQIKINKMTSEHLHIGEPTFMRKEVKTPKLFNQPQQLQKKQESRMKESRKIEEPQHTYHQRKNNQEMNRRQAFDTDEHDDIEVNHRQRKQRPRAAQPRQYPGSRQRQIPFRQPRRPQRRDREQRPQQNRQPQQRRQRQPQNRQRPQHRHRQQPRRQGRNNRNPRYESSSSRRSPTSNNFFNLFSNSINEQLSLMNNQFSMMSNVFENFSNFVNINIDSRGNHVHFSSHFQSSDEYDTQSSESFPSDYDDYYDNDSEPEGLNEEELDLIQKIRYSTNVHGRNQCTICLIYLNTGENAKKLYCGHIFHGDCIDEWLKRKSDCPVCRDKQ